MKLPYITNIQKYSIHDGRGIRTTVFFKGCPLSCAWCHNPETQAFGPQVLVNPQVCTDCGACRQVCPQYAEPDNGTGFCTGTGFCIGCETCLDYCVNNARELSGRQYTVKELVKELEKDRAFYEQSGGGVTFSGGEVLAQDMDYVENLARELKRRGLSLNIDTCGAVPFERIERILPWTDTFLYDVKLFEEEEARKYTGSDGKLIFDNLEKLSKRLTENENGRPAAEIWIRMPVIGGVNDTMEHMERAAHFLKEKQICCSQVNLLPYHNTGSSKYARMGQNYEGEAFYTPSKKRMEQFAGYLKAQGFPDVKIGG
ncbi:MAG: glycyl-radical enzyme activating protein [Lachnospiraceae bacterium]